VGLPEFPPEWLAMEYAEDDVNQLTDVAHSPSGVSTLYEATHQDPSSSLRWHANITYGSDQEMIAALRTRGHHVWGAIGLYRQPDRPLFDAYEQAFLALLARSWRMPFGGPCSSESRPIPKVRMPPA
jgi:hypothetical protein